jgi:hypothetical protein
MLSQLKEAIAAEDGEAIQDATFEIGQQLTPATADAVAVEIIAILRRPSTWTSELAGHILNFFEFEATKLPQISKDRCAAFLREWGNEFTGVHAMQVVSELRHGPYLKPLPTPKPKRKPRHASR